MPSPPVLIFGGTFDPPHRAHVELPPLAAAAIGCERIIYVPAAINPLKADHPPSSASHRLAMLRLALRGIPNAQISTIELDRPGPSYTIDTIHALQQQLGKDIKLRLLIGADQALEFHRWKDWRRLIELAPPAVMLRPPWDEAAFAQALRKTYSGPESAQWMKWTLNLPRLDISATALRQSLQESSANLDALDPQVAAYIRQRGLYGHDSTPGNHPRK